jgi:Glycosyltransferase family 87
MSMLTLRQVPLRYPESRRFDWPSPTQVPRVWMTAIFAVSAAYALIMALVTSNHLHRLWGVFAACAYLLAAMVVLAWRSRGLDCALLISLGGALVTPLVLMANARLQQPEVRVINKSASMLVHQGTPYVGPAALAAAHSPNVFDPYLPLMTVFGMPRALLGFSVLTDPRIWFMVGFLVVFATALLAVGVKDTVRWTVLVTASPVIAFSLAVGGTDVPVLACMCLGLALLWREPHPVLAGLAFGVAAAMKATAWPALLVAVILLATRDGKRAAWTLIWTALAVVAVIVGPVAVLWPRALVQNTVLFPLGLASIKSQAVSPLPGHLLVETGEAGHLAAVALLALACLGIVISLVVRPPRTVPAATWRLVIGLSLLFVLAPATRFGYFLYPLGLLAWLGISWLGSVGAGKDASPNPDSGAGSARSANSAAQSRYQAANQGSSAASGTMCSTVWA